MKNKNQSVPTKDMISYLKRDRTIYFTPETLAERLEQLEAEKKELEGVIGVDVYKAFEKGRKWDAYCKAQYPIEPEDEKDVKILQDRLTEALNDIDTLEFKLRPLADIEDVAGFMKLVRGALKEGECPWYTGDSACQTHGDICSFCQLRVLFHKESEK